MRDVVVIGSGISGLGAALQAARYGRSVTLLEAAAQPGGLIRPVEQDGYRFDVGLQYVGQAGPGETFPRFLEELGVDVSFRPLDPDCGERYVLPGWETRLVAGPQAQEALLREQFPHEAAGLRWFFDTVQAFDVLLGAGVGERRRPLRLWNVLRRLPSLWRAFGRDTASFLSPHIRDPRLITALSCFIGDMALPPGRASAFSTLLDWAHFQRGAWFPVGGGGAVVDGFLRAMAPLDVDVRTGAKVERVRPGRTWEVALQDGEPIQARSVISCVDATASMRWVDGPLPRRLQRRVEGFRPSLSAYGAFLGVRGDLRDLGLGDGNLWHYEHDDLEALFRPLLAGREPEHLALFFAASSLKDPGRRCAPEGQQSLTVLAWAPSGGTGEPAIDPVADRTRVDRVLQAAERALPGLAGRVVYRSDVTPHTIWSHGRGRGGGYYGPEMSPEQSIPWRFFPTTGLPGLYLAGSSIFGCGVLPALLSGRVASRLAHRHLG
jgi:all-trans-retinol 13,14-reductase